MQLQVLGGWLLSCGHLSAFRRQFLGKEHHLETTFAGTHPIILSLDAVSLSLTEKREPSLLYVENLDVS